MNIILHPTDFTVDSEHAFRLACSIAHDQLATVTVIHVVDDEICPGKDRIGDELRPDSVLYQSNWNRFEQLRALADQVMVTFQLKVGQPVEAIANLALHENCDLIVVAARYHDSLIYTIHSSVATCLKSQAHCPVLTLSQPSEYQRFHSFETIDPRLEEQFS